MTLRQLITLAAGALLLTGFGPAGAACDVKFTKIAAYTAVYKVTGTMQSGDIKRHSRKNGCETAEFRDLKMSMAGMNMADKSHVITKGKEIINIKDGRATVAENPMYDGMADAVKRDGAKATTERMMAAMGFQPTGEKASFIGRSCNGYKSPQMGSWMCMDGDIPLAVRVDMGGMVMDQIIQELRLNDPGPDSAYKVPAGMQVSEMPDLGAIMSGNVPQQAPSGGDDQAAGMPQDLDLNALKKQMELLMKQQQAE